MDTVPCQKQKETNCVFNCIHSGPSPTLKRLYSVQCDSITLFTNTLTCFDQSWSSSESFSYINTILHTTSYTIFFYYYLVCEAIGSAATPGLLWHPKCIVKLNFDTLSECRLAGETEVLGENLPQRHFCPSQNPKWPDPCLNTGRRGGKPATNRLRYGAAIPCFFYLICEAIGTAATPGLLWQPRVIVKMIVEKQMECRLTGETEVFSEKTCPSATFVHQKTHTWLDPGWTPGRRGGKPATNRLSYGAVLWLYNITCISYVKIAQKT
jgi:hypothetical protein